MYNATIPPLLHYLGQIAKMVERAGDDALDARIADSFSARQHFLTAAGFSLRLTYPLLGREPPDLPADLGPRLAAARALLLDLRAEDFDGADRRMIHHRAGFADLEQTGRDYALLYALPNFFFHITMGYASLRNAGVPIGKGDFDGFHSYPADFRFP